MKTSNKLTLITLAVICLFLSVYRLNHVDKKEISWDVLGYYLYLPSTFIYHEPMLDHTGWLEKINTEMNLTGTLYMVSSNDEGKPMYFFLMGMALFYLPFFLLGHGAAPLLGFPADGFSPPYQYALVIGGIIYTIIGLIFLRKILKHFFSEGIFALVMIIIVFGTNYIHHLTLKNLETVNVLFMLVSIVIWHTIKWHENQKIRHMIITGAAITLMGLVKPTEVLIVLLPLLWNVFSMQSLKEKLKLFYRKRVSLLITLGICLIIVLPQIAYWYIKTGHIVYDSYKNPGIGLDLLSPHLLNVLFSYRKGWFLYTPVMIFSLWGLYFLFKENRKIFPALFIYFLIAFYILASWTEWWYGAAFSTRPVITLYPVLAIGLGYFLMYLQKQKIILKITAGAIVLFFIFLNQFQWWQLKHYILDPYRTTGPYYWATFLKTSVNQDDKELLLVERSFTGQNHFEDQDKYNMFPLKDETFNKLSDDHVKQDNDSNYFYTLSTGQEFYLLLDQKFRKLTRKDHVWIKASLDIRYPDNFKGPWPCLVMTVEHSGGNYGYLAPEIKADSARGQWGHFELEYLTPEIRSGNDRFKCYIWNRSQGIFDVDNLKIEKYERK